MHNILLSKWIVIIYSALILALCSLFYLALPETLRQNENVDFTNFYQPVAERILNGQGITRTDGSPEMRYPPGFSIAIAGVILFSRISGVPYEIALRIFIMLCYVAAGVCVLYMGSKLWSRMWGFCIAIIWALYPLNIWFSKQPNSELLYMPLLYVSVFLLMQIYIKGKATIFQNLLIGLSTGLCLLIRPISIGMPFIWCILVLLCFKLSYAMRLVSIGIILCSSIAVVAPWEAHIYNKTGKIIPLSSNGKAALIDGLTVGISIKNERQGTAFPDDVREYMQRIYNNESQLQSASKVVGFVIHDFPQHYAAISKLFIIKAARSWFATDSQRFEFYIGLIQVPFIILTIVALLLCFTKGNAPVRFLALTIVFINIYFWGMNIISTTLARYQVPSSSLFVLLWPIIIKTWTQKKRDSHKGDDNEPVHSYTSA